MNNIDAPDNSKPGLIPLLVLGGLLLLRLPFFTGAELLQAGSTAWVMQVFDIGTYFLTAILIWLERRHLEEFHITPLALVMILVFKPLMPVIIYAMGGVDYPLSITSPVTFLYLVIAVGLSLALIIPDRKWKSVPRHDWIWLGWGVLGGLGIALLTCYPMALSLKAFGVLYGFSIQDLTDAFIRVPHQIGYAAITEEPLFRGFLWGYLKKYHWKEGAILVFQTGLFMLGHAYYLKKMPLMLWVSIPLVGFGLGLLVWRSRTIATSMAAHTMVNAFTSLFAKILGMWIM